MEENNTNVNQKNNGNNKTLLMVIGIVGGVCVLVLTIFLCFKGFGNKTNKGNDSYGIEDNYEDDDDYVLETIKDIKYVKLTQKEQEEYKVTQFRDYEQDVLNGLVGKKSELTSITKIKNVGASFNETHSEDNRYSYKLKIEDNQLKIYEDVTGYSKIIENVKNPKEIYIDRSNYVLIVTNDNYYYMGYINATTIDSKDTKKQKLQKVKKEVNYFETELSRSGGKYPAEIVEVTYGGEVVPITTVGLKVIGYTDEDYYIVGNLMRYDGYGERNKDYKISDDTIVHLDSKKHFTIEYKGKTYRLEDQDKVFVTGFEYGNYIFIISTECGDTSHWCQSGKKLSIIDKKTMKIYDGTRKDYGVLIKGKDEDTERSLLYLDDFMYKKIGDKYQIAIELVDESDNYIVFDDVAYNETFDFFIYE